jgi:hypothetical protein
VDDEGRRHERIFTTTTCRTITPLPSLTEEKEEVRSSSATTRSPSPEFEFQERENDCERQLSNSDERNTVSKADKSTQSDQQDTVSQETISESIVSSVTLSVLEDSSVIENPDSRSEFKPTLETPQKIIKVMVTEGIIPKKNGILKRRNCPQLRFNELDEPEITLETSMSELTVQTNEDVQREEGKGSPSGSYQTDSSGCSSSSTITVVSNPKKVHFAESIFHDYREDDRRKETSYYDKSMNREPSSAPPVHLVKARIQNTSPLACYF